MCTWCMSDEMGPCPEHQGGPRPVYFMAVEPQDRRQRPKTLYEASQDLDAALSDLRAVWERPMIALLRSMAKGLQRLGRWMHTRGQR